ncbi:MAG: hypothetical protein QXW44_08035 [Pyrobaculum sp.]
MLYKVTTIAAVAVIVVLAALLGMYHTETVRLNQLVENYKSQVANLNAEVERQKIYIVTLTSERDDLQRQVSTLKRNLQDLEKQRDDLQRQVSTLTQRLNAITAENEARKQRIEKLENEMAALVKDIQAIRAELNKAPELVEKYASMLKNIRLDPPVQITDSWTFVNKYSYTATLHFLSYEDLTISMYANATTVEVRAHTTLGRLPITIYRWIRDPFFLYWRELVVSGNGSLTFTPRANGTYVIVIRSNSILPVRAHIEITRHERWHFCEDGQTCPRPHVTGPPVARELFKFFALYNYWLNERERLARQVRSKYPNLTIEEAYALSLAALLKSAGFGTSHTSASTTATSDVSFAAISFSREPLNPVSVIVSVAINTQTDPSDIFYTLYNRLPAGWLNVMTIYDNNTFRILVDTYNVHKVLDRGETLSSAFNVVYIDGYTTLPG